MPVPGSTPGDAGDEDGAAQTLQETPTPLLLFSARGEYWGLPLQAIHAIHPLGVVTRVPNAPPAVVGIQNLRGRVLTLYDLGRMLGGGAGEREPAPHIIVLTVEDPSRSTGIVVGEILQVIEAPLPLGEEAGGMCRGVISCGGRAVSILDPQLLLSSLSSLSPSNIRV